MCRIYPQHPLLSCWCLYTLLAKNMAKAALYTVVKLVGLIRSIAGPKATENQKHGDDDSTKDHQLSERWAGLTELCPLHAALAEELLQLLSTELVVDETAESDAVAKGLDKGNGVAEEEHGRENKENVLEYTGEGENEGRSLANLNFC
jgi:hypothetical protein